MPKHIPLIPWLLVLASCSSPPKPPTVDESQKRPVNSQMAVELHVCKNDLQNTRLMATESGRVAILAALNLADELFQCRERQERYVRPSHFPHRQRRATVGSG